MEEIKITQTPVETAKFKYARQITKIFFGFLGVVGTIIIISIGIAWLVTMITIWGTDVNLGYDTLFGLPSFTLSALVTAALFVVYWPIVLLTKGAWSISKNQNRFNKHLLITGGILFACAIGVIVAIGLELAHNLNLDYQDGNKRILIENGMVCVSSDGKCE